MTPKSPAARWGSRFHPSLQGNNPSNVFNPPLSGGQDRDGGKRIHGSKPSGKLEEAGSEAQPGIPGEAPAAGSSPMSRSRHRELEPVPAAALAPGPAPALPAHHSQRHRSHAGPAQGLFRKSPKPRSSLLINKAGSERGRRLTRPKPASAGRRSRTAAAPAPSSPGSARRSRRAAAA